MKKKSTFSICMDPHLIILLDKLKELRERDLKIDLSRSQYIAMLVNEEIERQGEKFRQFMTEDKEAIE